MSMTKWQSKYIEELSTMSNDDLLGEVISTSYDAADELGQADDSWKNERAIDEIVRRLKEIGFITKWE